MYASLTRLIPTDVFKTCFHMRIFLFSLHWQLPSWNTNRYRFFLYVGNENGSNEMRVLLALSIDTMLFVRLNKAISKRAFVHWRLVEIYSRFLTMFYMNHTFMTGKKTVWKESGVKMKWLISKVINFTRSIASSIAILSNRHHAMLCR